MVNLTVVEKEVVPVFQVTPAIVGLICEAISRGLRYEEACALVGLSNRQTISLKKDAIALNEGHPRSLEFDANKKALLYELINRLPQAQASFIDTHLRNIDKHSVRDWKASRYLLEVTDPDRFKVATTIKHEELLTAGANKNISVTELSDKDLLKIIDGEVILEEDDKTASSGLEVIITEHEHTDS